MYNQGHHQGQNAYVNGGGGHGHQRYGMNMNMNMQKQFQPNQHHTSHNQSRQQEHGGQGPSHGFGNHQHNTSNSGFAGGTPTMNLRNGTPNTGLQNGLNMPQASQNNHHWQLQLQLFQQSREMTGTHSYARQNPQNKALASAALDQGKSETDKEEANRPVVKKEPPAFGWNELDMSGQGLRALSSALFLYPFLKKLYINRNNLLYLPAGIGRLRGLCEMDASHNELTELPVEIGMLTSLKKLLLFDNQLEALPYEMGSLHRLQLLGIEGNPLAEDVRTLIMEEGTSKFIEYLRDGAEPDSPPKERDWIVLDEAKSTTSGQLERFTVLDYNILADNANIWSTFGYTPKDALAWERRKEMILEEVRARDADIVCLQEVDSASFHEFLRPALAENGYKGIYYTRTRARTMTEAEVRGVDGCAMFVKNSKYIVLDKQYIDFVQLAINRADMKGMDAVFNRLMPRDHIGTVAFLENRETGSRLIVGNAHLFWDHAYRDVKTVQTAILMEALGKIAEQYAKVPPCTDKAIYRFAESDASGDKPATEPPTLAPSMSYPNGPSIPMVLCGDFNSGPLSGVYELLSTGSLAHDHPDLLEQTYGDFTTHGMTHPFTLRSAYSNINELRFTNYTDSFNGVLDYIWYSPNSLQATGLLGEVDPEYLKRVPGFPNWHFPSDHLVLLTEFVVKPKKEQRKPVEVDFGQGSSSKGGGGVAGGDG